MYDILRSSGSKVRTTMLFALLAIWIYYAYWMYQIIDFYGAELGLKGSTSDRGDEGFVATAFGCVYSLPILIIALILGTRLTINLSGPCINKFNIIKIFVGLFLIAFFELLVLKSLYMTAIVLSIMGIGISVFYTKGQGWFIKSILSILLILFIFLWQYGTILNNVKQVGNQGTKERVEELYLTITGEGHRASDMSSRQGLSIVSFETFLRYPLFGANHVAGKDSYNNKLIGNHSEWLDMLALYGIFAFLLFYVVYQSLKFQYRDTGIFIPSIFYIVTGFFNPMFFSR